MSDADDTLDDEKAVCAACAGTGEPQEDDLAAAGPFVGGARCGRCGGSGRVSTPAPGGGEAA